MQAQDLIRHLRIPELDDLRQYVRSLPTNTLMGMGAFAAITTYWLATRPKALKPPCDLHMQSVEVQGSRYARRSILQHGDTYMTYYYKDAQTMYEFFLRGLRVSNNGPCLGSRKPGKPYKWLLYKEVADRAEFAGSALLHRGHSQTGDKYIGIFAQNRPEWTISELACYTYSLVAVPLYDTLGTEAISYIIDKATISTVICDIPDKARLILDCVSGRKHSITTIVIMGNFDRELTAQAQQKGIEVLSLKELEDSNSLRELMYNFFFLFFSTGSPKGAMLTHGNVVSNCSAFIKITEGLLKPSPQDVLISFLPLAHMFERVVEVRCISHRTCVCVCVCVCFTGSLHNGTLKIIDRKKHIFKLAQGEYIAPEKIENIYIRSDPVAQVFVHGDSLQACLVGVVVPDPDFLPRWVKKRGIEGSYTEMCKSKELKNAILEDIIRLGKEAGLKSFEQVRDIALHMEMFSVQNGLLTPTLKAKRTELRIHFREQIDQLYAKIKM
uniref:long-chain-fatty-acid--CoA ligase n=1 Tax=Sinocyclocheilus grahami TaxID=75366 RepID=A0A672LRX7_SINGR